jgi:hypothetical protein
MSNFGGPAKATPPRHIVVELKQGVPYMALDVECVATAVQHNARATAQMALVSQAGECVLNLYVKPAEPVVSYLSPLTSLSKELIDEHGLPLETAMARLRKNLPRDAILVGQNIAKDVEWLCLKEGEDFASMIDLAALFRVWSDRHQSFTYFGQDHVAACLLGEGNEGAAHNAVTDAMKSMRLFNMYVDVSRNPEKLAEMQRRLIETPPSPSFAKRFPSFEGCCMGNRKTCTCGAPFFS